MILSFQEKHLPRRLTSNRHNRAFSLIEMLIVVTIGSLLTALTMSSISSLRSVSLTSSGNEMVDVFNMARQNSIAKNAYTAVVIKTQGTGAGNAYCLLELTRNDDGSLGTWTALTPWRFLGKGSVFEVQSHTSTTGLTVDAFQPSSALPEPLPSAYPFQGQQVDLTVSSVAQCYQPDGTLAAQLPSNTRLVLRLTQGQVDSSSGVVTYQGTTASGEQASFYDLVFVGNTGMTKIERF